MKATASVPGLQINLRAADLGKPALTAGQDRTPGFLIDLKTAKVVLIDCSVGTSQRLDGASQETRKGGRSLCRVTRSLQLKSSRGLSWRCSG